MLSLLLSLIFLSFFLTFFNVIFLSNARSFLSIFFFSLSQYRFLFSFYLSKFSHSDFLALSLSERPLSLFHKYLFSRSFLFSHMFSYPLRLCLSLSLSLFPIDLLSSIFFLFLPFLYFLFCCFLSLLKFSLFLDILTIFICRHRNVFFSLTIGICPLRDWEVSAIGKSAEVSIHLIPSFKRMPVCSN